MELLLFFESFPLEVLFSLVSVTEGIVRVVSCLSVSNSLFSLSFVSRGSTVSLVEKSAIAVASGLVDR